RYTVLAERAFTEQERNEFAAMADEEQEHKQRLQKLLADRYPNADFYLLPEEKDMVVDGPRLLDVRDEASFAEAMEFILNSERRTSSFYRKLSDRISQDDLRALFRELADEGVEHYQRLKTLADNSGLSPSQE
ncbi:MAG: ferritin family protein, partial [Phycisphaerae bacterium]